MNSFSHCFFTQKIQALKADGGDAGVARGFQSTIWPVFVSQMENANGPRFGVIDFSYISKDDRTVRHLVVISYCPDKGVTAKQKMTFASTKTSFETKINIGKKYQANDLADLEYQAVYDVVAGGK